MMPAAGSRLCCKPRPQVWTKRLCRRTAHPQPLPIDLRPERCSSQRAATASVREMLASPFQAQRCALSWRRFVMFARCELLWAARQNSYSAVACRCQRMLVGKVMAPQRSSGAPQSAWQEAMARDVTVTISWLCRQQLLLPPKRRLLLRLSAAGTPQQTVVHCRQSRSSLQRCPSQHPACPTACS